MIPSEVSTDRSLVARGTLWDWVQLAWSHVEPSTLVLNWHLPLVCENLEAVSRGRTRTLVINEPPGCGKSLLTNVLWPVWHWTALNPSLKWIYGSYDQSLVGTRDGGKVISLMRSEWYRERWGERLAGSNPSAVNFSTTAGGFRFSTSPGGRGTGRHGNIVVIDDPTKPRDARDKVGDDRKALRNASAWYNDTLSTRQVDPATHREVIVMQRLHKDDLAGEVLRQGEATHLCLPMRYDPEIAHPKDPRTERGQLLFPKRFPEVEVRRLEKRLGPTQSSAQHGQRPALLGGKIFRRTWWRFWHHQGAEVWEPCLCDKCFERVQADLPPIHPQGPRRCLPLPAGGFNFSSWDFAFKGEETSDFVCGGAWRNVGDNAYLLHFINERLEFVDSQAALLRMAQDYECISNLVEDKANGPAVVSALERVISGLELVTPEGGKTARAHASEPPLAEGRIILPHPDVCPMVWILLSQCEAFPRDVHDDIVDMVTQAIIWLMSHSYADFSAAMRAVTDASKK